MNMIRYDPFRELMHHWLFHQNQNFDQPYGRGVQGEETRSVGSTWTPQLVHPPRSDWPTKIRN